MHPNDADGIANSVDPDLTALLGAVLSGSTLFAQTCLSETLRTLWYSQWSGQTSWSDQGLHCLLFCLHRLVALLYGKTHRRITAIVLDV